MLALLASTITLSDPAGDARGDGGYVLPTRPAITPDMLDLRAFSAQPQGEGMRLTVSFSAMGNPWNAPSGHSAGVTDIFVKGPLGGQQALADTGLRVRGQGGWAYHLRVSGGGASLVRADSQGALTRLPTPQVQVSGTSLIIDAAVPPGTYGYWVTNSVYTPLSATGVLRPVTQTGPTLLQAGRADAPTPVDVLAPAGDTQVYSALTLAPVGETRDWVSLTLIALGVGGLLLTVVATVIVWRRLAGRP
ncbi:glucodextranase DOMON-like domain-containing protein [Deinococcus aquaedulcis]|uniref:glucodextranase DOMON-like domain-containing protein n=1 Tax=Deinococcus aquaedulcis TaxID=2840455 RepID=UPI002E2DABD1|nr:glucodextranase DOMON-like domain-containing protein [Deinococcus aquaedulcis]